MSLPTTEIFQIAGRFLDKKQLEDCARLYRFCRFVDDLVDEVSDADAAQVELDFLKRDLERGHSSMPVVEDFIDLASQCQMQSEVILELIRGIESDLQQFWSAPMPISCVIVIGSQVQSDC